MQQAVGPAADRPGSRAETEEGLRQAIESADKNFIGLRETTRPAGELLRLVVRPQEVVAALIALERGLRAILGGRQRVQRGPVRPLSCARPASPVGHVAGLRSAPVVSLFSRLHRGMQSAEPSGLQDDPDHLSVARPCAS